MLKRIMFSIVLVVLLVGVENLVAQEQSSPKQGPEHGQIRRSQNAQAEQLHRQRTAREVGRGPAMASDDATQPFRHEQNKSGRPQFGRWFDKLARAYRANDNEKMGQLIRKMHRLRQRRQQTKAEGEYREDVRSGAGMGRRCIDTDMPRRGTGKWDRGFRRRGVDWLDSGILRPPFGDKPGPDMPPRVMDRRGRDFQRRGMGGRGWDIPEPEAPEPGLKRPGRWID